MAQLYSDSDSDSSNEDGQEEDQQIGTSNAFKVNKEFAQKYETKKRTEELSKLQDKYGKNYSLADLEQDEEDDEEDLSDDDSDAELVTPAVDVAILRTLARIKKKDPAVYEAERQVFDEEEQRTTGTTTKAKKETKSKPVLLKDYQRSRLIADPTNSLPDSTVPRTFAQEESALKEETKMAFFGSGEGGEESEEEDLLVPRLKSKDERRREDEEYDKFLKDNVEDREVEDALEQEEKFLRDYILNRGWIDRANKSTHIPSYSDITGAAEPALPKKKKEKEIKVDSGADAVPNPGENDDEDLDEERDAQAEEFEHKYNFRFEEEAGPTIQTHARDLTTSVRKPTIAVSARARARETAKERKAAEKAERKEEVRRLKALKRKEVEEKLRLIVEAAGKGVRVDMEGDLLEGEWDEVEHERKMKEMYGGEYEMEEDEGWKPEWEDDIDIGDIEMDEEEEVEVEKKEKKKRKRDEEGFPTQLLDKAKMQGGEARKEMLDKMVDEYYGLDYEDKVGDITTRFGYTKVAASSFSLTPAEILLATDAELNEFMSLRKLAPYRQDGEEVEKKSKKKLKELKERLKGRKWGEEIDMEVVEEREMKKRKWREEGKEKKRREGEGDKRESEESKGKKRMGKKERSRKKAEKDGEGEVH